jgi:hypothetical protein
MITPIDTFRSIINGLRRGWQAYLYYYNDKSVTPDTDPEAYYW